MKTEYDTKASAFLAKAQITFAANFMRHGKYWDDDKESRNIYCITMTREGFGAVIRENDFWVTFGQSIVNTKTGAKPKPYDVLACLTKYDPGSFENFCSEFGYNTDSKRAEKTYHVVVEEWTKVKAFFSPAEIEELQEIN